MIRLPQDSLYFLLKVRYRMLDFDMILIGTHVTVRWKHNFVLWVKPFKTWSQ